MAVYATTQDFSVPGLTPGQIVSMRIYPWSPYGVEGPFTWLNESMFTDNITTDSTPAETSIDLRVVVPSGTGEWLNVTIRGTFSDIFAALEQSSDFSE